MHHTLNRSTCRISVSRHRVIPWPS
jgi:hypothetical protein